MARVIHSDLTGYSGANKGSKIWNNRRGYKHGRNRGSGRPFACRVLRRAGRMEARQDQRSRIFDASAYNPQPGKIITWGLHESGNPLNREQSATDISGYFE